MCDNQQQPSIAHHAGSSKLSMSEGGGMQIARFNSYALLFLKVEKISIQNYIFLESLLYQESII